MKEYTQSKIIRITIFVLIGISLIRTVLILKGIALVLPEKVYGIILLMPTVTAVLLLYMVWSGFRLSKHGSLAELEAIKLRKISKIGLYYFIFSIFVSWLGFGLLG